MQDSLNVYENTELHDVARLFFDDAIPPISIEKIGEAYKIAVMGKEYLFNLSDISDAALSVIPKTHLYGRLSKIALYDALSAATMRKMPWGALTGVRPTKLFYECLNAGKSESEAADIMRDTYRISESRACILRRIVYAQRGKINYPSDYINLYIHVPYCKTICSYCSFVSAPISKFKAQAEIYVDLLCDEISKSSELLERHGKKILSVYIGGGTPTALNSDLFSELLDAVKNSGIEYTCEAGRPDTVTEENAKIMKAHGVTRVCVNPQTLNNRTLETIGRTHSAEDFFAAYKIAQNMGFDINCDLIAGLADETLNDFAASFDGVKALSPSNITIHSLSRKNGSGIRYSNTENENTKDMIEYAFANIGRYRPYYLYRQKRQSCNLENVGFSLSGKECVNNITTMEETVGVMACGSGAISKYVHDGEISRFANLRDTNLYIQKYNEKLKQKLEFFDEKFSYDNDCK